MYNAEMVYSSFNKIKVNKPIEKPNKNRTLLLLISRTLQKARAIVKRQKNVKIIN